MAGVLQFALTNLLMISAGVMLYLVVRALPRGGEDPAAARMNIFDRWRNSPIPEKIDAQMNAFLTKFLRRLKVWVMKFDNFITDRLKGMKSAPGGNAAIDFKEIANGENGNGNDSENASIKDG